MFNNEQKRAIDHNFGAAMVIAGPGTGKTTVLTERIKRLVATGIAKEEELLVVTFTKAAAKEMQQRYEKRADSSGCRITFGTFHSVFFRILRESSPAFRGLSILKEEERVKIIKEIVLRFGIEHNDIYDFVKNLASEISKVNGQGTGVSSFVSNVCDSNTFIKIYNEYEKALSYEKKIDFDDMVSKCHELLQENDKIRKYWQDKFRFILIDEFQDINKMQYETIGFLVGDEQNIFVVGDDDQAIYGFRGSDNQIMFDFKSRYRKVEIIKLKVNYRSTKQIVSAAFKLVGHNSKRFKKNIRAFKGDGEKIEVVEFEDNIVQYRQLVKQVEEYIKKGIKPNQIAILVRNNGTIPVIRNFFSNRHIKLTTKYKNNIYNSTVAKDLLSYVRCATADLDLPLMKNKDVLNIINKPYRGIGRHVVAENEKGFKELLGVYEYSEEVKDNIKNLMFHLNMIGRLDPYGAVNYIYYGVGYEEYMKEHALNNHLNFEEIKKTYDVIWREASNYRSLKEWMRYVERQMNVDLNAVTETGNVNLLTMHASKGLEYKIVFIPDCIQGVIPEARALREYDIDEERRLLFVAMTRAIDKLHIYYNKNVMGRQCQKSQFIDELFL